MRRGLIIAIVSLLVLAWPAYRLYENQRFFTELANARREIAAGSFASAGDRLKSLLAHSPDDPELHFLAGICDSNAGNIDSALANWNQIPTGSLRAAEAASMAGRLALDHGRYRVAEERLLIAARGSTSAADDARQALGKLYWFTGRSTAFAQLLRDGWTSTRDPAGSLRVLWQLEADAHPLAAIGESVENAYKESPNDDRVWLAKADLATRSGEFAEAESWLSRCEKERPNDVAVSIARLNLALATENSAAATQALRQIPANDLPSSRIAALRAWFAARRGDNAAEKTALKDLITADPSDSSALERLAVLATASGDPTTASDLRRRKSEIDRDKESYRKLIMEPDPTAHARELAALAERLGRRFDARSWWTLESRRGGDDSDARAAIARLGNETAPPTAAGKTAADLLADVLPSDSTAPKSPNRRNVNAPVLVESAEKMGLRFTFNSGQSPQRQLPETMSGGIALIDYDGDGLLDVYTIQGGQFPPPESARCSDRLFRNRGDGTFEDVTKSSRIADMPGGYGHGTAVGDFDNDGHADLFITRWRSYSLYRNRGDGTFEDITVRVGLGGDRDWPTSAAWSDLDGDGDLDLYVCHYLAWDSANPRLCQRPGAEGHTYCDPRDFAALPDHLFRNDGGKFVDVSSQAGLIPNDGRGLGVVAADVDDDGKPELFVANDTTANLLYHNLGGLRFRECGTENGVAGNASGSFLAGMGIGCGDLNGDGLIDLAVTNFYGESTTFYRGLGGGQFGDGTVDIGLAAPSRFLLGFGIAFLDLDNDGHLDLATANGHVNDYRPSTPYAMSGLLMMGTTSGRLIDVSKRVGASWEKPRVGRGLAAGDLDNDGRVDLLLVSRDEPLAVFHNETPGGNFVTLQLEGTKSQHDAIGSRVTLTSGGRRQVAQRFGGGSYLSASDGRLHFGVGAAQTIDAIEIRWPSGRVDTFKNLATNRAYLLREGNAQPQALNGWKSQPAISNPAR